MEQVNARSIFSPATGYIRRGGFDWTCNPYVGCSFGCTYCYAMFLPQNRRPRHEWGKWFQAKTNAIELAKKQACQVAGQAIYLSSVTDPYLPAERSLRLTRGILEVLVHYQPRLLVQTRSPMVVRDLDLLQRFGALRINLTIPTDSETVRKAFEPKAPRLEVRWQAAWEVRKKGLPLGICLTPMLPLVNPESFIDRLAGIQPDVVVTQDFQIARGFGASTSEKARHLMAEVQWSHADYQNFLRSLRKRLVVYEGEVGFFPPEDSITPIGISSRRLVHLA